MANSSYRCRDSLMQHRLATAEKNVLVELVKQCQQLDLRGQNGGWKEFLDVYDKKFGSSLSDPRRRSSDLLIDFLMTFRKEEDLKSFDRVLQHHLIEKFKQASPDKETHEERLLRWTLEHPNYPLYYTFPSYAEDWFVTDLREKSEVMKSSEMIAVDCEMVLCEDGTEAVVSVAAVDCQLNVKFNEHVKPNKTVADYRTDITGVCAADIEKADWTLARAQQEIRSLLSGGTILVGHGLNNDLQGKKEKVSAFEKIDHARVIDTALIFKYSGTCKHRRPSLNNLCKYILGYEVRRDGAAHNCEDDAKAAMNLVLAVIEKGVDTTVPETEEMLEHDKKRLFIHRIPHNVTSEELRRVVSRDFTPEEVKPLKKRGGYDRAIAVFRTPEEANQTFENLEGDPEKDSLGLPQKLVTFKLSSGSRASLYVRKMVQDNSFGQISAKKKRTYPDENTDDSKKRRRVTKPRR